MSITLPLFLDSHFHMNWDIILTYNMWNIDFIAEIVLPDLIFLSFIVENEFSVHIYYLIKPLLFAVQ